MSRALASLPFSTLPQHDTFTDWWNTYEPQGTPEQHDGPMIGQHHRIFGFSEADTAAVDAAHSQNPLCVWSVVESNGVLEIVAGRRCSNCIGYFITGNPAPRICERIVI